MARFKKGSAAAKAYMAKLRGMVGKGKHGKSLKVSSPLKVIGNNPTMAKRRYFRGRSRSRRRGGFTIPIAPILGLAAGLAKPVEYVMQGQYFAAANHACAAYTGYDINTRSFHLENLMGGLAPLVAGLLVHKFVGGKPLGLNAVLARSGVPFIRI